MNLFFLENSGKLGDINGFLQLHSGVYPQLLWICCAEETKLLSAVFLVGTDWNTRIF